MHHSNVTEKLLDTRRAATPVSPASSEVVQRLPNNCPKVVEKMPRKPNIGPNSIKLGRFAAPRPNLAKVGQSLTKFDRRGPDLAKKTNSDLNRPSLSHTLTNFGPKSTKAGQCWSKFGRIDQNLDRVEQVCPNVGRRRTKYGRDGRLWPKLGSRATDRQLLLNFWTTSEHTDFAKRIFPGRETTFG